MEKVTADILADFVPHKPENVELVACIVRTAQTKTETCEYSDDHHLEVFEGTFEITIREARTAAIVKTGTASLAPPPCWGFTSFKEKTQQSYPNPEAATAEIAREVISPREGGAPLPPSPFRLDTVSDSSLEKVCHGFPEGRAAAYAKAEGKVSPVLFFSRENDRSSFGLRSVSAPESWKVKDGKDYQLVACVTEKSRTKTRECKFDETKLVREVDYYGATYEVTVRETKTAKVVSTQTVTEEGEKACPSFYVAIRRADHVDELPFGGPATMAAVKPLIAP